MPPTMHIDPDTVYPAGHVALALDVPQASLDRARREGRLRYARIGQRILIRGRWLLEWLDRDSEEVPHER